MPKLVLKTHLFNPESGETLTPGQEVEASEERAKELISRGTAVLKKDAEAEAEATATPRQGEVVEEFELNENNFQHLRDAEGDFWMLNGEEVDENAFTNALQAKTQAELDARHDDKEEEANSTTPLAQPNAPVSDSTVPTPTGTTPDQILDDLKVAE